MPTREVRREGPAEPRHTTIEAVRSQNYRRNEQKKWTHLSEEISAETRTDETDTSASPKSGHKSPRCTECFPRGSLQELEETLQSALTNKPRDARDHRSSRGQPKVSTC